MSSNNPYASNNDELNQFGTSSYNAAPQPVLSPSILVQLRVIGILLIINGVLALLMGSLLGVVAAGFPMLISMDKSNPEMKVQQEQTGLVLAIVYGVIAVVHLTVALLQIVAGIQNLRLRGRILGITAISLGLLTVSSCYCFPTSLGLFIYGLIIYLHPSTRMAFELASQGHTWSEIEDMARQMRFPQQTNRF